MKTYHVGGTHFLNRFSNLEAAVKRAQDDDIIELHKDAKDVNLYVSKNITIKGNGHLITPADSEAALDCLSFVTLEDIRFECKPRTNAVIIRNGGNLSKIYTTITGPARALYPTVVQRGGTLTMENCNIMFMETYKGHKTVTATFLKNTCICDYFNGFAYLDNQGYTMSKFREKTSIRDSVLECCLFEGECEMEDTVIGNFNKVNGKLEMYACTLASNKGTPVTAGEPVDGPLKDWNQKAVPFSLHISGGRVTVYGLECNTPNDCIGFYMTSGSLDIRSTVIDNDQARHLIKGGAVVFNNVTDNGFYEIRKARCGIIRSNVNTSAENGTAMEELDKMIGLGSVKKQLHTIMNTIHVNMQHPEKDFGFSHHMVFAGDPGTGKTSVAKLAAQALFEMGAIPENKLMEVPASQFVKGYVGQTGEHAENILKQALGGVLFIDEAYELMVKDGQNTFNNEALAVLLRYMEDHRGELVVIAAGYEKEMREFLASNVGLTRRFQWVSFEDYKPDEMADIFLSMCSRYEESLAVDSNPKQMLTEAFYRLCDFYLSHPDPKGRVTNGGNGGLVRNVFQQVIFARNNRIARLSVQDSMSITESDVHMGFREEVKKAMNVTYGTPGL